MDIQLIEHAYDFYKKHIDYLYLKSLIDSSKDEMINDNIQYLVVGSSYSRNGIDSYCLENVINCSLVSLDIYYECLLIRKLLSKHNKIRWCFCFIGYYDLFRELEKQENCKWVIDEIIDPAMSTRPIYSTDAMNVNDFEVSNRQREVEELAYQILKKRKTYYSDLNYRFSRILDGRWKDYSEQEKHELCKSRCSFHNKFEKYTDSYHNNCNLIIEINEYLKTKEVGFAIIIPPYSQFYLEYISESMKRKTMDFLNEQSIEYIDFNSTNFFSEMDFVDMDHLNGRGAMKVSSFLAEKYCVATC